MEQRHYCPCDKKCDTGQYYDNWCYGELCEDAKNINATLVQEAQNNIIRLEEEHKEYIKQLDYALRYFENEKTYDNNLAYSVAIRLIKNELAMMKD